MDVDRLDIFTLYKGIVFSIGSLFIIYCRHSVFTTGQKHVLEGALSCKPVRINIQVMIEI